MFQLLEYKWPQMTVTWHMAVKNFIFRKLLNISKIEFDFSIEIYQKSPKSRDSLFIENVKNQEFD